jgi:DNA repair protein RadC
MLSTNSQSNQSVTEECPRYREDQLIQEAITILEQRIFRADPCINNPKDIKDYLRLKLTNEVREVFSCVFLDSKHRVIAYEPLFFGTIDTVSTHPRVILQRALELHSAAVIMAHNHPSGNVDPSECDRRLTKLLRDLLSKIDVRLLDHFIIGKDEPYSFAENGLL